MEALHDWFSDMSSAVAASISLPKRVVIQMSEYLTTNITIE